MAPRANWKGYLRLSLVSCPVVLYPATSETEKVHFHQINKATGNRVHLQKVDAETGDSVGGDAGVGLPAVATDGSGTAGCAGHGSVRRKVIRREMHDVSRRAGRSLCSRIGHIAPPVLLRHAPLLLHISTAPVKPPHSDQSSSVFSGSGA